MKRHFVLIFTIFLLAFTADGQTNRGILRGQVKDAADAVIVGATVTVIGENGNQQTTQTDKSGAFSFKNLATGKYTVRAQNQGFAPYENAEVEVSPNENALLEVQFEF